MIRNSKMNIGRSWKGTGKNERQFLWRRNLEGGVMSKLKIVNSKLFPFSFHFLFYFQFISLSILRTRIRVTRSCCHTLVTSGDMVTSHETHRKI